MMRRTIQVIFAVVVLIAAGSSATAQDEPEAELQRVEVPAAGVAVSFPADWSVDIEMSEREDWGLSERFEDAAPLSFWNVLYASADGRPWCDVTWYPRHPMTLDEHAFEFELLMTPSAAGIERTVEVTRVSLPAGEARHFAIYNEPSDTHTSTYLLDVEPDRYFLQCVDDERAEDDWLGVAEMLEPLTSEVATPRP